MRSPVWLAALLPLVTAACATTSVAYHPQKDCEAGSPGACVDWADQLAGRGELLQAEAAYGQGCQGGVVTSCITQGQLLTRRGELEAAELPLRKAYLEEMPEAHEALAELYQARGTPEDVRIASGLRFEAPAIDKPATEFVYHFRMDSRGLPGAALTFNIQPMAFLSRRLDMGFHAAFGAGPTELNGFIGYQHFASTWAVPYARALLGGVPGAPPGQGLNFGGELGLKLCLGPLGHLDFAVGSSRFSPLHASVGLGFNGLFLLLLAAR
ncbi:hypothetical protein ATI61_11680 [Archangium gephyra]|uniref:Lipoprotein n=1 Tax=Archangium gephyra TaxID=48 RepID=A0AAC8QB58_9BACT|nr:hypothetical protein [Archangium gephyra]AKJ03831.1 putative lipoprotein [Archangium gephyra]REG23610.1 hypothetical protein ATI61_11680 [Archangium gephyra]